MATRNHRAAAAPQPANRGAARVAGKQNAAAAAAGTRRALGDIGNVVSDALDRAIKLPEGIHRPITRSFGAQLMKAALANKNADAAVAPAQPVAARAVTKPARKVTTKNVPRPGAGQAPKENKKPSAEGAAAGSGRSVQKNRRKKPACTLSTVLSARSKAACGLTEKPKEPIEDIDKFDGDNQLALVDYVEDIYTFYKTAQHESRPIDYMGNQPELSPRMRSILADWLIESHRRFQLMPETLYLTIYIVDRYLSLQPTPRRELQLVGVAALLIACKYEEIWAPEVNDLIHIADGAFNRSQILAAEKAILNSMEWNLTVPTPYHFLLRFAKAAGSADEQLQHTINFFGELALMDYGMVMTNPSTAAACAVYAARLTLGRSPLWTETLKHHTGLNEQQIMEGAKTLVGSHAASASPDARLKAVYQKYATEQFGRVALHPPAPAALPDLV
ncbi:cyclin 1 [Zea mays]|uniref:Cyclin1 n=1 Tax=Zea mays TaxID=4577 RepID=K7V0X7_MAIZE|nr:cyclin 1 [Zea mays]AQK94555.1 Cyclin1 [Zea mays]|eukprot:NP_001105363.2 cyclin 1 [Zea mays]